MIRDTSLSLQAHRLSPDGQTITWRILHHSTPRFLTAPTSSIPERAQTHEPLLLTLLPPLPAGSWTTATLVPSSDLEFQQLQFAQDPVNVEASGFSVGWTGSGEVIDAAGFRVLENTDLNRGKKVVKTGVLPGKRLRWRYAVFPEDLAAVQREINIQEKLKRAAGLVEGFVGYVKEGEGVSGYVTEAVEGERAGEGDLGKCAELGQGLERVGVKLDKVVPGDFIRVGDGVMLVDLEHAVSI